ncbi:hypothetical protein M5689_023122 [Euphorbia peplus]|nr:hypothetical protein M5689_023122 [Euphorbia peplus]
MSTNLLKLIKNKSNPVYFKHLDGPRIKESKLKKTEFGGGRESKTTTKTVGNYYYTIFTTCLLAINTIELGGRRNYSEFTLLIIIFFLPENSSKIERGRSGI